MRDERAQSGAGAPAVKWRRSESRARAAPAPAPPGPLLGLLPAALGAAGTPVCS